jgi:hypothetical protein
MDTNNNIFFTVEDNLDNDGTTKLTDIDKMMDELLNDGNDSEDLDFDYGFDYGFGFDCDTREKKTSSSSSTLAYFDEKNLYVGVPEAYYDAHTIKELMKICQYYDLAKNVKSAKCKKQDIVATIVFFEAQPENKKIVNKRHKMWAYMRELTNDLKMKEYLILWN